jgi:flavodoxin
MNKTLITYFSRTGNTKKVAEAIYQSLKGEKEIKPIEETYDLQPYNLIFIGFPVHAHSVPYKVEQFLIGIPPNKKIAFFSTHGSLKGHRLSQEALEHASVVASKARVLGTFSCRGKLSLQSLEALGKSPEHQEWTDMAISASTHPDEHDLADAKAFAKEIKTRSSHSHY